MTPEQKIPEGLLIKGVTVELLEAVRAAARLAENDAALVAATAIVLVLARGATRTAASLEIASRIVRGESFGEAAASVTGAKADRGASREHSRAIAEAGMDVIDAARDLLAAEKAAAAACEDCGEEPCACRAQSLARDEAFKEAKGGART